MLEILGIFVLSFPFCWTDFMGTLTSSAKGISMGKPTLVFFEAKLDRPGIKKIALDECLEYQDALDKYGLLPNDLVGLYQETTINRFKMNLSLTRSVLPLILSNERLKAICNIDIKDLERNYSNFVIEYLNNKGLYFDSKDLSDKELLPLYPVTMDIKGQRKGILYYYNTEGERVTLESGIMTPTTDYNINLNNCEIYQAIKGVNENRDFIIHFCLNGNNRPNFFFEYDCDRFICLQNQGKGAMNFMGIFNKEVAYDYESSFIYSTFLVEKGKYRAIDNGGQRVTLNLQGDRNRIILDLSFGKNITFSSRLYQSNGIQMTLFDI